MSAITVPPARGVFTGRAAILILAAGLLLLIAARARAAGCTLQRLGELAVTMRATQPLVHAGINGKDALFLADTGAAYSTLNADAAADFRLHLEPAPSWMAVSGVGGEAHTMITQANVFSIFGINIPHIDFFVVDRTTQPGLAGILGQNVFRLGDMEFDLAHNVIRLLQPHDCDRNASLAYWAAAESKPYSVIDIDAQTRTSPHIVGEATSTA